MVRPLLLSLHPSLATQAVDDAPILFAEYKVDKSEVTEGQVIMDHYFYCRKYKDKPWCKLSYAPAVTLTFEGSLMR